MRADRPFRFVLPFLLAACSPSSPGDDTDTESDDAVPGSFSVVVIPDTQIYADRFHETLQRHGDWILEHVEDLDIRFVSHVGDIVNDGDDPAQWDAAKQAFGGLRDAGIPQGYSPANHDIGTWGTWSTDVDTSCMARPDEKPTLDCGMTAYKEAFGNHLFADQPWFAGGSPSGESSMQTLDAEGLKLAWLHLPMDPPEDEVAWAEQMLDAHPDRLFAITTHRWMYDFRITEMAPAPLDLFLGGRWNAAVGLFAGNPQFTDSVPVEEIYERLVSTRKNVWSVHCGHIDAEFRQESVNAAGLPVHEVLVDYQDYNDGGGGLLRVLTFTPEEDRVEVYTVSTETGEMRENGDGFDHAVDILDAYAGTAFGALEDLGLDTQDVRTLLEQLKTDQTVRDEYFESLYGPGQRDSQFLLDIPFGSYVE